LGLRIGDWDCGLPIEIADWDLRIGDWDCGLAIWDCGLAIGIADWRLGLRIAD
jgi:hypothetical protein